MRGCEHPSEEVREQESWKVKARELKALAGIVAHGSVIHGLWGLAL